MQEEWILEVCHDMHQYAEDNRLPHVAAAMKLAVEVASLEIFGCSAQCHTTKSFALKSSRKRGADTVSLVGWQND